MIEYIKRTNMACSDMPQEPAVVECVNDCHLRATNVIHVFTEIRKYMKHITVASLTIMAMVYHRPTAYLNSFNNMANKASKERKTLIYVHRDKDLNLKFNTSWSSLTSLLLQ